MIPSWLMSVQETWVLFTSVSQRTVPPLSPVSRSRVTFSTPPSFQAKMSVICPLTA